MANHELDQVFVLNPTDQPFGVKWGGIEYRLGPGEKKIWVRFLAQHYAKHLANSILMQREQAHKKAFIANGGSERDYVPKSYLNSRTMRPEVLESILVGVYQYHQGQEVDPNALIQQQIDQMNPQQQQERVTDLGEAPDPMMGVLKDDGDDAQQAPGGSMLPTADATLVPPITAPPAAPTEPVAPPAAPEVGRSMKDLMAEAKKLGVTVPFGSNKDQVREIIRKQYA